MILRLSVDRLENGVAVCYDDDCKKYEIPAKGLREGALIDTEFDADGNFISARPLAKETKECREELASRTKALFKRNKK